MSPPLLFDVPVVVAAVPRDRYVVHRWVAAAMVCGDRESARDWLFAVARENAPGMLVVRTAEPNRLGSACCGAAFSVNIPPDGARCAFWLRAAPRRHRSKSRRGTKAYIAPTETDRLREWLSSQGDRHGFRLIGAPRIETKRIVFNRKGVSFVLPEITFTGRLEVVDRDRVGAALRHGIGPARTLGYGLLQLHRIEEGEAQ